MRGELCWVKLFNTCWFFSIQFKKSPPKIPYKAIALAIVLFMIGTFLIIIGALLLAGYISKGVSALITLLLGVLPCSPVPQSPPRTGTFCLKIPSEKVMPGAAPLL